MSITFSAIGLVATDLPASLAFYRQLGLKIPAEADTAPHVDYDLGTGLRLMWDPVETITSFDPDWTPPTGTARIALAFDCGSAEGVDQTYQELNDAGYVGHKSPWDAFRGQRYATVFDPDGNPVDLFAALPS